MGKGDNEGRSPIYVRITIDGQRAQFSLHLKIHPDHFNAAAGKAKGTAPEAARINSEIHIVKGRLQEYFNVLCTQSKFVSPDTLKSVYLGKNMPSKTLLQLIAHHNETFAEKVGAGHRSVATLKKYNATREKVRAYTGYSAQRDQGFSLQIDHSEFSC